jgi:NADH-quinone oxidoreductase subunit E
MALSEALRAEFDELCSHYPERRAALIPALHRCQEEHQGWLAPEVLEDLAAYFELEPVEVFGVASFYPMFHLEPVGTHVISVCHNISCALRGAESVLRQVCALTGARPGLSGTSSDGRFTVKRVECQGACANAPMLEVGGVYHEDLDEHKVSAIISALGTRHASGVLR